MVKKFVKGNKTGRATLQILRREVELLEHEEITIKQNLNQILGHERDEHKAISYLQALLKELEKNLHVVEKSLKDILSSGTTKYGRLKAAVGVVEDKLDNIHLLISRDAILKRKDSEFLSEIDYMVCKAKDDVKIAKKQLKKS